MSQIEAMAKALFITRPLPRPTHSGAIAAGVCKARGAHLDDLHYTFDSCVVVITDTDGQQYEITVKPVKAQATQWECPYCSKDMPEPNRGDNDACCGEVGHALVRSDNQA